MDPVHTGLPQAGDDLATSKEPAMGSLPLNRHGSPPEYLLVALLASSSLILPETDIRASEQPLLSLHGMTVVDYNVDLDTYRAGDFATGSEIWAKGDATRQEIEFDGDRMITIQRGELICSFSVDDAFGMVIRARGGLGAMGLVRQIEEIKAHGTEIPSQDAFFDASQLPDEAEYDIYRYEDRLTGEVVHVALTKDGAIPRIWVGLQPNQHVTVTHYWDMEANVDLSDSLFEFPDGIDLSATSVCEFAQQQGHGQLQRTCNEAIQGDMAAQGELGHLYFRAAERMHAEAEAQEYKAAAWWYRRAAMAGQTSSQHNIGFMYLQGRGVEKNHEKAVHWFRLAADKGYPPSEYNLGKAYMEGLGVVENHEVANRWLHASAQHGYAAAQFHLGLNYLGGLGVDPSSEEGYAWLTTAAAQGFDVGQIDLSAILADMTVDQRRRAEELASRYVEKYSSAQR